MPLPLLTRSKTRHQLPDFDLLVMNYMISYKEGLRVRSDPLTQGTRRVRVEGLLTRMRVG